VKEPSSSSSTAETKTYSAHGLTTTLGNASVNYHGGKLPLVNLSVEIPSPAGSSSQLTYDEAAGGVSSDSYNTIYYKCSSGSSLQNVNDFRDSYVSALAGAGFEFAYEYEFGSDYGGVCYFNYTGTETLDTPVEGYDGNYYPLSFTYSRGRSSVTINCARQIGTPDMFAELDTGMESYVSTSDNLVYLGIFADDAGKRYHKVGLWKYRDGTTTDNLTIMFSDEVSAGDVLESGDMEEITMVDHGLMMNRYSSVKNFNLEIIAYDDSVLVYYLSCAAYHNSISGSTWYDMEVLAAIDLSTLTPVSEDDSGTDSDSSSDTTIITPGITTGSTCAVCNGKGTTTCNTCHGHIKINCKQCNGSGTVRMYGQTSSCSACGGVGWTRCTKCTNGSVRCTACGGTGRIG
jgi:hypothetical protein